MRKVFLGSLLAALVALVASLGSIALADFDQKPCFPLGAGGCARVTEDFAVDGGQFTVRGKSAATVGVNLHDRDAADDEDNARLTANCTVVTSALEDCDVTLSYSEDGVSTAVLTGDADAGITIGSATNNLVTIVTDGLGDGEVVFPAGAIGPTDVADIGRSIHLPLAGWLPCALEGGGVWDTAQVDTEPDLGNTPAGTIGIVYDDTAATVDTGTICTAFIVPADYGSGGSFRARVIQDAATTNIETFSCQISVNGAALGAANAGNNISQTASQLVTSTPAGTWAAGASIQVACNQGNGSADDIVTFQGIEGLYLATQ